MKISDFIIEAKVLVETRTPNQILMELNVINIPQIDTYLTDVGQNLPTKETQKWFISRSKKYLINSEEDNSIITNFTGKAEPWMKQRQKEGAKMYRFNPSHDLTTKLAHIVDWVRAMNDTVTGKGKASDQQSTARAKKAIKGLNNTSITQAIELSKQWVTDMNSGKDNSYKRAEDETGLVPVMVHGEYKWYKLTDQDCLDREGKVMGHCVASYGGNVMSGRSVIYSLRDNNNFAHATVEVENGKLEQVKGKSDRPPVEKYQRATVALLNTLNVPPTHNGLRDINGMDFLYNANNHKYGTVQDIGDKVYDEGGISVWSIGGKTVDTISMRILVGDKTVCNIGSSRYGNGLEYQVNDADAMISVKVKDAKYSDPLYKLAKFITQVIPQTTSSDVSMGDLSSYMGAVDAGLFNRTIVISMFEDMGELVFTDANSVLRFVPSNTSGNDTDMYMHLTDGKHISNIKYNEEEMNIGDRKTLTGTGWGGIVEKSNDIVAKYVNSLKQKDRPIVQNAFVFQHPTTFEASTDVANASETIAVSKSGDFGWYKIINSNSDQNSSSGRRRRQHRFSTDDLKSGGDNLSVTTQYILVSKKGQKIINIDMNEDETNHKFNIYYSDAIHELSQADAVDIANLFNKSGMNKYFPFTDSVVVSLFEENGLYFLREKRMFTTDHSIAGEQFKHEDKAFKAIKTHNHLKIYHKDAEVVVFDLDSDTDSAGVKEFHLKNKLTMLNNVRKIADVLNHYDIHRKDQNDYNMGRGTNRKIAQAGLTYSYENGWKGMKNGPKPVETSGNELTRTIGKSKYEIHSFKRDFLIQDAKTHELVATFKGWKEVGNSTLIINKVKMDSQTESAFDIVADALNELSSIEGIRVNIDNDGFKSRGERENFDNAVMSRDYTGTTYGGWRKLSEKFPTEVISKGAGGTWIKEAFVNGVDASIKSNKEKAIALYSDRNPEESAIYKYDHYGTTLDDAQYTLYNRKTPVLRILMKGDKLQVVYVVTKVDDEIITSIAHDKETLLKHGNAIGRLLHKLEANGGGYLTDHQLYLVKGKLKDITMNPKLAGFTSGEIVYEDGHKWKKSGSSYRENQWILSMTNDGGTKVNLIKVTIDGDGIDNISFEDPKVRKYTKLYRPFLNDIMDIVDQLYGSD